MRMVRTLSWLALLAPLLAACETQVPARSFPQISFAHQQPFNLDVVAVHVEKEPVAAPESGSIVHELPVSVSTVAEEWARQRLKAVGSSGTAVVRIEKASVVEERLTRTGGLRGAFTTDQSERYTGDLAMSVTITDDRGQGIARASARRIRTVAENATLAEREKLWFEMVEHLAREVDSVMDQQIRTYLTDYLR